MTYKLQKLQDNYSGSVDVMFNAESGYVLSWSNNYIMTPCEYALFCTYLSSPARALICFGAQKHLPNTLSEKLFALYSMAAEALACFVTHQFSHSIFDDIDGCVCEITPILTFAEIPEESRGKLLSLVLCGLSEQMKLMKTESVSDAIDALYNEMQAANTVCFGISENHGNTSYPMSLSISCKYNGSDTPLSVAYDSVVNKNALLFPLRRIASQSKLVSKFFSESRVKDSLPLSPHDLYVFLTETEKYSEYGINCRIPRRWRKHKGRLSVSYTLGNKHSLLCSDELILSFDINICLNGEKLSDADIQKLLTAKDDVFLFREHWVELKLTELRSALAAYERAKTAFNDGMTLADAVRAYIAPSSLINDEFDSIDTEYDVLQGDWLASVIAQLSSPETLPDVEYSDNFRASLRPYQRHGVNWLFKMNALGLGACLCDDMGLGKTIQAIGFIDALKKANEKSATKPKTLIVIPASLLVNWSNEFYRFAPHIRICMLHNSFGDVNVAMSQGADCDVFITTYSMLTRIKHLRDIVWDCVIIDEAQSIKNPTTLQSRAVKKLHSKFRIAMTGTPVENSAMDLWSIFNFLNPNLLGASKTFLRMLGDNDSMERMKKLIRPFMLRRLKTDKSIIADLPEKIEMLCYCSLTPTQVVAYKRVTDAMISNLGGLHGMERRGAVLTSILRLKQICNHPDQLTGSEGAYLPTGSGKMMRLIELCESIMEAGEKVLVFTQFRELCEPLSVILASVFNHEGLVIHGKTSIADRGEAVERFNAADSNIPFIVLSLRAGGVGLNLTAATHVIHFDRWWNPAVENQATDRAFRIGQTKNVIVHKMICMGTLEENIDKLISGKTGLAYDLIDGELKLSEMSDSELISLVNIDESKQRTE